MKDEKFATPVHKQCNRSIVFTLPFASAKQCTCVSQCGSSEEEPPFAAARGRKELGIHFIVIGNVHVEILSFYRPGEIDIDFDCIILNNIGNDCLWQRTMRFGNNVVNFHRTQYGGSLKIEIEKKHFACSNSEWGKMLAIMPGNQAEDAGRMRGRVAELDFQRKPFLCLTHFWFCGWFVCMKWTFEELKLIRGANRVHHFLFYTDETYVMFANERVSCAYTSTTVASKRSAHNIITLSHYFSGQLCRCWRSTCWAYESAQHAI